MKRTHGQTAEVNQDQVGSDPTPSIAVEHVPVVSVPLSVVTSIPLEIAPVVSLLERGFSAQNRPELRAKRPDQQLFDKVTITTKPRYKTSHISGNQWRIGAEVTISYKGRTLWETLDVTNVSTALQTLARDLYTDDFLMALNDKVNVDDLCDQEGCDQPWTHVYRMKNDVCVHCATKKPATDGVINSRPALRKFCERHAQRGNQGLEDVQDNYEVVSTPDGQKAGTEPIASTLTTDESRAGFAGTITADGAGTLDVISDDDSDL